MKTKLLKKTRKRFSIVYCPSGYWISNIKLSDRPTFVLFDIYNEYHTKLVPVLNAKDLNSVRESDFRSDILESAKQVAINSLKDEIIHILRRESNKLSTKAKNDLNKSVRAW